MNNKRTILLVDDSQDDLFLLRVAFQKAEFHAPLQEVHNGEEAIAYLKGDGPYADRHKHPMPVMLLDLNMPMKNGFDVLRWLHGERSLKRMSIIVLTASMRMEDVEQAFDLGAHSFLVKASNLEGMVKMVRCLGGVDSNKPFSSAQRYGEEMTTAVSLSCHAHRRDRRMPSKPLERISQFQDHQIWICSVRSVFD